LYYCIVYSAIQPLEAASVLNKISYQLPLISKKISGAYTPGPPLKGGREGRGEGEKREGAKEGRPPIHIPGYATGYGVGFGYQPPRLSAYADCRVQSRVITL